MSRVRWLPLLLIVFALTACQAPASRQVAEPVASLPLITADGSDQLIDLTAGTVSLADLCTADSVALYGVDGSVILAASADCLLDQWGRATVADGEPFAVVGVLEDPPPLVTTAADLADQALAEGRKVMLIYLDGLGYDRFISAGKSGDIPTLAAFSLQRAATVYPSITPVGFAAMISGATPDMNGVRGRNDHQPICETIFDRALAQGKSTMIVEGDSQILQLAGNCDLNPDVNGDDSTDDEVLAMALANLDHDLLLVHFHGIDDTAHKYAPWSEEDLLKIRQIDQYIAQLVADWDGLVIVTADHGQHVIESGADGEYADKAGGHGDFRASDILIPLLTMEVK